MSGNPVKVRDGYATVTGYKLSNPLVRVGTGKARARLEAPSQDTDWTALVSLARAGRFSVKEKDETSLPKWIGRSELNAFIHRLAGV